MKWYSTLLVFAALAITGCSANISEAELLEKTAMGLRLVRLEEGVDPVWKTQAEVLDMMKDDVGFFDVTDFYDPEAEPFSAARVARPTYKPISQTKLIKKLAADVSIPKMQGYLSKLTSFHNRFYKNETGVAASLWIRDTLRSVARANPKSKASVSLWNHVGFNQTSIIATIPGRDTKAPRVILGAHMDSINRTDPFAGRAPGADDDGSGTVNVMEAFRVLASSSYRPQSTIEFHLYAGEEAGLLGSQSVSQGYRAANIPVKGMFNLDMTAYIKPGTKAVVGFLTDYTNPDLTKLIEKLVDTHLSIPWIEGTPCGYACSDHASWYLNGFPSAGVLEGDFNDINQLLHSDKDTVTAPGFSWTHSREYAKLAVAFAVELSSA